MPGNAFWQPETAQKEATAKSGWLSTSHIQLNCNDAASKVRGQRGKPSFRKTSESQQAVGVRLPCRFVDLRQVKAINQFSDDRTRHFRICPGG